MQLTKEQFICDLSEQRRYEYIYEVLTPDGKVVLRQYANAASVLVRDDAQKIEIKAERFMDSNLVHIVECQYIQEINKTTTGQQNTYVIAFETSRISLTTTF